MGGKGSSGEKASERAIAEQTKLAKQLSGETAPIRRLLINDATQFLGIPAHHLEAQLLATSLSETRVARIAAETKNAVPGIMSLYLTHNQSALTDFRFMGFPFHYWYTAEFLLILFVMLCLIYCVLIAKINKKYKIEDI